MSTWKLLVIALLSVISVVFVVQNSEPVAARFLGFELRASQALMLFATLAAGFALGILVTLVIRRGKPTEKIPRP